MYLVSNNLAHHELLETTATMFKEVEARKLAAALSPRLLSAQAVSYQLLQFAGDKHDVQLLEQLHSSGIDLDMSLPGTGLTVLQTALPRKYAGLLAVQCERFVQRLLELGANPSICGRHSCHIHTHTSEANRTEPPMLRPCCCCKDVPLILASRSPSASLVAIMLEHGARVCDCFDLTEVIDNGTDLKLLLRILDARPGLTNHSGKHSRRGTSYLFPLQAAIGESAIEVAKMLLDRGADVNINYTKSMHDYAVVMTKHVGRRRKEQQAAMYNFLSLLTLALLTEQHDLVVRLLDNGARPDGCYLDLLEDQSYWTREQQAWNQYVWDHWSDHDAWEWHPETSYLADPNQQAVFTPLQAAVHFQSTDHVRSLLNAGASTTCR